MLPEPREGTGTAEGVALVAPGLSGALEEQREEGLEGVAPGRGKGHLFRCSGVPTQSRGPGDHPWPTLSCPVEHPFPGPPEMSQVENLALKRTRPREAQDVSGEFSLLLKKP